MTARPVRRRRNLTSSPRPGLVSAITTIALMVLTTRAAHGHLPKGGASSTATGATVTVSSGGSDGSSGGSSGASSAGGSGGGRPGGASTPRVTCATQTIVHAQPLVDVGYSFGTLLDDTVDDLLAWQLCTDSVTGHTSMTLSSVYAPADGSPPVARPTADEVAAMAAADLHLVGPTIATAPPRTGLHLAGVRTWFWATDEATRSATASIPGLSATVTARALELTVTADGGGSTTCTGAGRPHPSPRADACTLRFDTRGRHTVTATVRWELRWTATDGTSGTLPDTSRSTTFTLAVSDGIALTD